MRYLLDTGSGLLLAFTVRFIAGHGAAVVTFVAVLAYALWLDRTPGILLLCSASLPVLVWLFPRHCLLVLEILPFGGLAILLASRRSIVPSGALFIADGIALLALAYRALAQKRLLD